MANSCDVSAATLKPRRLLHGSITYSAAKECETNVLHELGYWDKETKFFSHLYRNRDLIKAIVAHHLGLSSANSCHLAEIEHWMHGSFNICIPVDIDGRDKAIIRFPLPFRVGEAPRPGNADEKILCEAGTYAWLQENCPDIPIPKLHGFGLSTGQTFTFLGNLPFVGRCIQYIRRQMLTWLGFAVPSLYVPRLNRMHASLDTGYLLIEYIDWSRGKMLSETWEEGRHDFKLRKNLFHGLSRTLLALARTPLPRIGSFTLNENGYLSLSNRPLTVQMQLLENEQIPLDIPRDVTYSTVDSYINAIFSLHESRLRYQPNAVIHLKDGVYQTSALMIMRSVWSCFFRRDFFRGPFFLSLTDTHQSNILVDDDWNIKYFIDLEWACSRPVEMIHPPHWLTNQAIDLIDQDDYQSLHTEFLEALAEEEAKVIPVSGVPRLHPVLQQGWDRGTFWCSLALHSPTALFKIFYDYIQPRFSKSHYDDKAFWTIATHYWTFNTFDFLEQRVKDKEKYEKALREAFEG